MAAKYDLITELYLQTVTGLSAPESWQGFLTTACRNFRLPFQEQVLLYAQRPDATAVLPIEGKQGWNKRFGRWVNRGAKGIAMFDSSYNGQAKLKYYFDIADTHESSRPRPVPIWDAKPEYEKEIIEALENSFGQLAEKADLGTALTSAAANAMEDNFSDYLAELIYYKENSFLESFDEETIEAMFKPLLQTSIGYMLLVRCGIDPAAHYSREDFTYLGGFNTLSTLNALGTATSDISQMCLSEIARTVLSLQRQEQQQNRTFEDTARKEYAVSEEQKTQTERSIDHDANHIQQTGRLSASQPSPAPGAGDSPWEVRIDAPPLFAAEPESDLHEPADHRDTEQPSEGDRANGSDPDRTDGIPDGTDGGFDGGTESQRPDEMGGADEQSESIGGGADPAGADLRIEAEPAAPEIALTASPEMPPLLEERFITAIIENRDDDLKSPKSEIQNFFREHYEQNKRAEYLKSVYPDRFTELIVDGTRIGYKAITDGLLMWEGAYLTRTKESVFSWGIVAELTGNLIDQGTYFFNTKIKAPPSVEEQISFMSPDYALPETEDDVDPSIDNMLKITNDGRKLALDMRLVNSLAPDTEDSKTSVCARNVYEIWERTQDKKSAQLVFCDLSTPTKTINMEMQDGVAAMTDFQNVYDDLKKKLIAKGIPPEEIAFIHDANTEVRKKELFARVRSGQVRVLIGSTAKMGAGTNVQDRLVALHDLDCPWRPSDLAQRLGRIVRQGNQNPEVEIFRYVTENTFDAYLYQLVENKQKFIAQIMTSKAPARVADDVDETALSYSEIKALATGNPLIIEKCNLDVEVSKLNMLKANHLNQRFSLENLVFRKYPAAIAELTERITGYEKDVAIAKAHPKPAEAFVGMEILGTNYTERKDAGKAIINACTSLNSSEPVLLGLYRDFSLSLQYDAAHTDYKLTLKGHLSHTISLSADAGGNITRMDNVVDGLEKTLETQRLALEEVKTQLANAKAEMEAPFAKEAELAEKSARLKELNILLNMDQKDKSLLDDAPEETPEKEKQRDLER